MTKRLLSAALMLLLTVCSQAQQQTPSDSSTRFIAALNAEQMMEKMGFDNLMKAMFSPKKNTHKETPEDAAQKTTVRKAMAAIYGAGLNLNKKMWIIIRQKATLASLAGRTTFKDFETPMRLLVIPVANRQVMEENIIKLAKTESQAPDTIAFKKSGTVSYLQNNKSLLLISNTEMVIAALPEKVMDDYIDMYYGATLKTDTVITPKQPEETIEEVEKPADLIEIDKLLPTGKIKRLYTYKKPNSKYEDVKVVEAPKEDYAMDTTAAPVEMIEEIKEEVAVPLADSAVAVADTLSRTEYLNDSTYVTYYYVPYTDAEKVAMQKKHTEEKEKMHQQKLAGFLNNYTAYLPDAANAVVQQLAADTADMVMYSESAATMPYSYAASFMLGAGKLNQFKTQPPAITAISFVNGQMKVTSSMPCCTDTAAAGFEKLYKPLTAFWPAALGTPALGSIQYNLDAEQVFAAFMQNATRMGLLDRQIKNKGIQAEKIPGLFTGEIAIAIQAGQNARGKKQPRLFIALKLKDAAAAVNFMNRIGTNKLKFTGSYRFDENAQYLLFDTDGKNGLVAKPAAATAAVKIPQGSLGNMQLNLKAMLQAFTKDNKKTDSAYKMGLQFLGNMQMISSLSNPGTFTTTITVDMGSSKNNALYNLLQLMYNAGGKTGRMLPPLGSILK